MTHRTSLFTVSKPLSIQPQNQQHKVMGMGRMALKTNPTWEFPLAPTPFSQSV